jgi:hypothetical protein
VSTSETTSLDPLGFCPSCGASRLTGDEYCGKCGNPYRGRALARTGTQWYRLQSRWRKFPWPKWIVAALIVAYAIGFHPHGELAFPAEGDCAPGYSLVPPDGNVCWTFSPTSSWHPKGHFDRGTFKFRVALYLETVDIRLFDLDFANRHLTGLGRCGRGTFGAYRCS